MTLEELLDKLINMGWKPFGDEYILSSCLRVDYSQNDLCSIDSGLWQFVVDNNILKTPLQEDWRRKIDTGYAVLIPQSYNYRLMLSSVQSDKAQFILDNIKL